MRKPGILVIIMILTVSVMFAKDMIVPEVKGNKESDKKVLVTGSWSSFKRAIMNKIIATYQDIRFEYVDYATFKDADKQEYKAFIIFDQNEAWMAFNGKTKKLIKECGDIDKLVLVITAGDPDWTWTDKKTGIEAITSASEIAKGDTVYNKMTEKLDKLLK